MTLFYLNSVLPIPEVETISSRAIPKILNKISEHELGVLSAQFESFSAKLVPYREKLKPIQEFLDNFESKIHRLSESLKLLQAQSNELTTGSNGHQNLVDKLNPVILDLVIPPSVSQSILKAAIDEKWVENIVFITEKQQLARKIASGSSELKYKDYAVFVELEIKVKLLEAKAIERIRNHLIEQIRRLRRSPPMSSQAVQMHLLQIKETYAFLKSRHPQLASQLQLAYVYTMKWYYTTRFAKYLHSLQKLKLKQIDQNYVLGNTDESIKTVFLETKAAQSNASNNPSTLRVTSPEYFSSVAKRISILADDDEAKRAIPSQIAETTPFSYWLEFGFHQFSSALLDNVIVEYLFAIDFFYQGSEKFDTLHVLDPNQNRNDKNKDWSHLMFKDVFSMGHSYANWLVSESSQTIGSRLASSSGVSGYGSSSLGHQGTCDSFAVLLMIRIIQKHNTTLHNHFHVPVMEDYHNALLLSLWPHFTRIIDINCESLKKNFMGRSSFMGNSAVHLVPAHTTQQFAQFLSGLFKLAFPDADNENDRQLFSREPISMSITRLRNDFEGALTKASTHVFGISKEKAPQREVFLFNNYSLLMTILTNEFESTTNLFIKEQISHFHLLCEAYKPK